MEKNKQIKRALVISGGGAKGAWAGGLIQQMIEERGYDWDMYFGSSTGSLLITLAPLKKMNELKIAYTTVDNKSIFSVNPFTKKGKINWLNAIWRTINKADSLGVSNNLEKKIREFFSIEDYNKIIALGKKTFPCATEYMYGRDIYVCNMDVDYDKYVRYTRASTSVPVAMNLIPVDNNFLLDGGVTQHVPIQKAIDEGADEIDIIILRKEDIYNDEPWIPTNKNWFDVLLRTTDIMESQISKQNVIVGQLQAKNKDVKLRFRYTPYKLTNNSLIFNKEQMIKWWQEGYDFGKLENMSKKVIIKK